VLPGEYAEGYTVTFTFSDGGKAIFRVDEAEYRAGMRYIYNIGITTAEPGDVSFGAEGDLKQISDWGDGDAGDYPGEIPKTNPGNTPPEELSAPWGPKTLNETSAGFEIEGDGTFDNNDETTYRLPAGGEVTIRKADCKGVATVSIWTRSTPVATSVIRSVTLGGNSLVTEDNGKTVMSLTIPRSSALEIFTFRTIDGKPHSGDLTIVIGAEGASSPSNVALVTKFATNYDATGK
jgi:hypothetical protein